jgi:hypothetical protein
MLQALMETDDLFNLRFCHKRSSIKNRQSVPELERYVPSVELKAPFRMLLVARK